MAYQIAHLIKEVLKINELVISVFLLTLHTTSVSNFEKNVIFGNTVKKASVLKLQQVGCLKKINILVSNEHHVHGLLDLTGFEGI